ncbi:MAG: FHA domain-containing protein [Candidatus Magnetobacterium sp. LHC-1]|uniref:FHA domain-containing protein n=1 Tax=Candidatus Magnetobacterium casense TaxID=1455061 RepID=A0ABS6RWU2_9BACT|nr:FHA domain-containing protein [Candidatus Magnetobacterium casensis]
MRLRHSEALLFVVLVELICVCSASALEISRVKELYANRHEFVDKQVVIEGRVDAIEEMATKDKLGRFALKDGYGDVITVKSLDTSMSPGADIRVEGVVIITGAGNDKGGGIFIHASRITARAQGNTTPTATVPPESDATRPANSSFKGTLLLIVAGVAAALIIALILIRKKSAGKPEFEIKDITFSDKDTPNRDTLTDRMNKASMTNVPNPALNDVTQQLLPGYLEITAGVYKSAGKKIFIHTPYTRIGRQEEGVNKGVDWITFPQDCMTVSRYQADLRYEQGQYVIISRSRVNPTFVNNAPLMENDASFIRNNDKITLGDVELTFRGK